MNGTAKRSSRARGTSIFGSAGLALVTLFAGAGSARAEGTEAPAGTLAQVDAPPPAPAPPPPAPPPPPVVAPPSAVEAEKKPPTASEAMPATRPDVLPPIDVGAWTRVGGVFQSGTDPKKLDDWHMDTTYVELHAGGKIHKNVSVTLNLNSNMGTFPNSGFTSGSFVAIMDAIVSFDLLDELHLWAGHLLVPVDRANASGPFFMLPWNYPGFLAVGPNLLVTAPVEGPSGRNNGAVVWGDVKGGKLTYLAGVFDNANVNSSPLFSGRLRLALWDPEPGFWGNASYFGDKDLLSIGLGAQFLAHGSSTATGGDKNWAEVNVDVLMEKKLGGGSFVTGEAAYYHNNVNDGGVSDSFYVLAAYATPTMGVGSLQPMVRYQGGKVKSVSDMAWNLDVGLAYLIKGPALRVLATYGHTSLPGEVLMTPTPGMAASANSIQLGAQAIFF